MAAQQTVNHLLQSCKTNPSRLTPRHGVVTMFGYGITLRVDRGHLILEDGIGADRYQARFPRVRHGLRRVVVVGADGSVSLAALRWLADQDAAFVMLDRDGSVLAITGPVRPSDGRLRRAQALAHHSGIALSIARDLIGQKLESQEEFARDCLNNSVASHAIANCNDAIKTAKSGEAIRLHESRAAYAYWGAWRALPISFPNSDLSRVPEHWRTFGTRVSPLTGSPRGAANPANAILNYLYALLELEARLAIAALGLDPGLGVLHADAPRRDSLVFDVMEPIRPKIDAYVFEWISRETFRRSWFFEQRDGSCRLMGSFTAQLSETLETWAHAVAPIAESVSRTIWSTISGESRKHLPATRLTQVRRREATGGLPEPPTTPPRRERFCNKCGVAIGRGSSYCVPCAGVLNTASLVKAARFGRVAGHGDQAQARRSATQRKHAAAKAGWHASSLPTWLNEAIYSQKIQPRLKSVTLSILSQTMDVSIPYAINIRAGRRVPHPRHWLNLARLAGVSPEQ